MSSILKSTSNVVESMAAEVRREEKRKGRKKEGEREAIRERERDLGRRQFVGKTNHLSLALNLLVFDLDLFLLSRRHLFFPPLLDLLLSSSRSHNPK